MKKIFIMAAAVAIGLVLVISYADSDPGNIRNTKHNLSSGGGQNVRAIGETQICVFCHTPHKSLTDGPLWNHTMSTRTTYSVYTSGTLLSTPSNPPDGDSKLCLSCHDGDRPIGDVLNIGGQAMVIPMTSTYMPAGPNNFGDNIMAHHPVSIEISQCLKDCKTNNPTRGCPSLSVDWQLSASISPAYLKKTTNQFNNIAACSAYCGAFDHPGTGVQCSSCHDAHSQNGMFLRTGSAPAWSPPDYLDSICQACHTACP
jgi:hypothetical protein